MGQNDNKKSQMLHFQALAIYLSDPYRIQTCNLLIRSQTLYSIELRDQFFVFSGAKILPFFELASIFANFFSKNFWAHTPFWHYLSQCQAVRRRKNFLVQQPGGDGPDDENHQGDACGGPQRFVFHHIQAQLGHVGLLGLVLGNSELVLIDGLDGLCLFLI